MKPGDRSLDLPPEDQAWLEALRGDANAPAAEAQLLRRALDAEARRADAQAAAMGDGEHQLQRLLFDLRREKVLESRTGLAAHSGRWALAAGLVLAVAVGFMWPRGDEFDEAPEWRGAVPEQTVKAAEPRAHALALAERLKALGVGVAIYRDPQGLVLDVAVPAERLDALRDALAREGLPAVAGVQRVRIHP